MASCTKRMHTFHADAAMPDKIPAMTVAPPSANMCFICRSSTRAYVDFIHGWKENHLYDHAQYSKIYPYTKFGNGIGVACECEVRGVAWLRVNASKRHLESLRETSRDHCTDGQARFEMSADSFHRNLDTAFPPFAPGVVFKSVYERAGFDVNQRARSRSRAGSTTANSIPSLVRNDSGNLYSESDRSPLNPPTRVVTSPAASPSKNLRGETTPKFTVRPPSSDPQGGDGDRVPEPPSHIVPVGRDEDIANDSDSRKNSGRASISSWKDASEGRVPYDQSSANTSEFEFGIKPAPEPPLHDSSAKGNLLAVVPDSQNRLSSTSSVYYDTPRFDNDVWSDDNSESAAEENQHMIKAESDSERDITPTEDQADNESNISIDEAMKKRPQSVDIDEPDLSADEETEIPPQSVDMDELDRRDVAGKEMRPRFFVDNNSDSSGVEDTELPPRTMNDDEQRSAESYDANPNSGFDQNESDDTNHAHKESINEVSPVRSEWNEPATSTVKSFDMDSQQNPSTNEHDNREYEPISENQDSYDALPSRSAQDNSLHAGPMQVNSASTPINSRSVSTPDGAPRMNAAPVPPYMQPNMAPPYAGRSQSGGPRAHGLHIQLPPNFSPQVPGPRSAPYAMPYPPPFFVPSPGPRTSSPMRSMSPPMQKSPPLGRSFSPQSSMPVSGSVSPPELSSPRLRGRSKMPPAHMLDGSASGDMLVTPPQRPKPQVRVQSPIPPHARPQAPISPVVPSPGVPYVAPQRVPHGNHQAFIPQNAHYGMPRGNPPNVYQPMPHNGFYAMPRGAPGPVPQFFPQNVMPRGPPMVQPTPVNMPYNVPRGVPASYPVPQGMHYGVPRPMPAGVQPGIPYSGSMPTMPPGMMPQKAPGSGMSPNRLPVPPSAVPVKNHPQANYQPQANAIPPSLETEQKETNSFSDDPRQKASPGDQQSFEQYSSLEKNPSSSAPTSDTDKSSKRSSTSADKTDLRDGPAAMQVQQDSLTSKKVCRGCKEQLLDKSVRSKDGNLSGRWHRGCLNCSTCKDNLAGQMVYVLSDEPYCKSCYHEANDSTCRMCGVGIEGECLESASEDQNNKMRYHPDCLRCIECEVRLNQSYFDVDGALYCAEHAFTSLPPNAKLKQRFTRFMMI